jgi:GH15 family glucan-1,4-alpha-glucosidase
MAFPARPSEQTVDGLPAGEGAFLPWSFWLVDAGALDRRHEEAAGLFERLLGVRNDLGLLAEEYDPPRSAHCAPSHGPSPISRS